MSKCESCIKENKYYSYNLGEFPRGCKYCVKGAKLVVFVTGKCPRNCYFCPVSDEKYQKDGIFANERVVENKEDLINEANNMDALGAGITGGDPLAALERTVEYIALLKKEFGERFHIHLYTSFNLVNQEVLDKLFSAGLDEIRFHPDLEDDKYWGRIEEALQFKWDVGIEIPLIPGKDEETHKVVEYFKDKVMFVNLNELEVADNEHSKLGEMGFKVKDSLSYGVKGSLELGLNILEEFKDNGVSFHLCTAKLKDAVQLSNRILREGKQVKKDFDVMDSQGLLIRGVLYFEDLKPGFKYEEKVKGLTLEEKKSILEKLNSLREEIIKVKKIKEGMILVDEAKPRILLSRTNARTHKKYFKKLGLVPAVILQYPTADQLEMEVEFL